MKIHSRKSRELGESRRKLSDILSVLQQLHDSYVDVDSSFWFCCSPCVCCFWPELEEMVAVALERHRRAELVTPMTLEDDDQENLKLLSRSERLREGCRRLSEAEALIAKRREAYAGRVMGHNVVSKR